MLAVMRVMWIMAANYRVQPIREFVLFLSPKNSIHQNCGCELHFATAVWFALQLACKQPGGERGKPRYSHEVIMKPNYTRR